MRTDCKRDNKKTYLPKASTLGFGLYFAKRGNWIEYAEGPYFRHGRVLGGVTADGKRYIEIIALLGNLDNPGVRWIEPGDVLICNEHPPRRVFEFMCGAWDNVTATIDRAVIGFTRD